VSRKGPSKKGPKKKKKTHQDRNAIIRRELCGWSETLVVLGDRKRKGETPPGGCNGSRETEEGRKDTVGRKSAERKAAPRNSVGGGG